MVKDKSSYILIIPIVVLIVLIPLAYWNVSIKDAEFQQFIKSHNCKVAEKLNGGTVPVLTSNGTMAFAVTPSQTAYLCNDGVIYWR